ncbi:MAG TPA: hypothetical protein VMR92_09695, partial [Gemmatimonadales bacterium]|nr:hypothetical protein [Gemmatimonadales bacterium]
EIGDADTIYARASGQAEQERVEFVTARKPKRLGLDPRQRAHDWNALNNYEKKGIWPFQSRAGKVDSRLDNPTKEVARRDRSVVSYLPLAWFNDYGGVTGALQSRSNYLGRFDKNRVVASYGFDPDATHRFGWYVKLANPVSHPMPRTDASIAAWNMEGRGGIAVHSDRSLRQHLGFGQDPHAGFDAIWMAVSDIGYVDRRLWDNAGTIEGGPWGSVTSRHGDRVWKARMDLRIGAVYRNPGAGVQSSTRYDIEGFLRPTVEMSMRTPFIAKTRFGVRFFAGGYAAQNPPALQRRIMIAGADPYTTFDNPLLRSRGALFVRPDFHYQAPGDANLRAFRPDLGGRWAVTLNLETTKSLFRRQSGLFDDVALEAFADAGLVDTLAVPSSGGQSYTTLYDGGVGVVTHHRINDLAWTMRFEVPLVVNRWDYAADGTSKRVQFRWQLSLEPSF